jgi:hypothetical protein
MKSLNRHKSAIREYAIAVDSKKEESFREKRNHRATAGSDVDPLS